MTHLVDKMCRVVNQDEKSIEGNDLTHYKAQIENDWQVKEEGCLTRNFVFPSYDESLEFTNKIAEIAGSEGHHPEIKLSYGEVEVNLRTNELDGLHENDFIMAAKIDRTHRKFRSN